MPTVPLAFDRIDGPDRPVRAMAFLHGILGRGVNLRSLAKAFVEVRPGWSAWLVDLRGHGRSPKSTPDPSMEAAARDVLDLARREAPPLGGIVGHSFGGKVALEAARLGGVESLEHVFVLDSVAGSRTPPSGGDSAMDVVEILESLPPAFSTRTEFADRIVASGLSLQLAQWLAGSVVPDGEGVRFALDLREIRALLLDYFARDLWPVVEQPPGGVRVHLVIGGKSASYSAGDRTRAAGIAAANDRVTVDVLPSGHWVHVEAADALLERLLTYVR